MTNVLGTGAFVANLLFILLSLGAGWLLGGSDPGSRPVTALVMVTVGAVMALVVLLPLAAELGKRRAGPDAAGA